MRRDDSLRDIALIETASDDQSADIRLAVNSDGWIDLIVGQKSSPAALLTGTIDVEDGAMDSVAHTISDIIPNRALI